MEGEATGEKKFWVKSREQLTRPLIFGNAEPLWSVLQNCSDKKKWMLTEAMWENKKLLVPKKLKNYEYCKKMNLLELSIELDGIGLSHGEAMW